MPQRTTKKKRSTTNQNRKRRSRSVTNVPEPESVLNLNPNQWLLPETKDYLQGNDNQEKPTSDTEDERKTEVVPTETKKIKTPYDEVKSYLKKNSLVAKGLTIFDVLYPASVTVREPRHVQVIDRYVLAKVWDDILPLTYGSYAGKLRLVNHYAVDLEKYEIKLKELITNYHQFTSKFVWRHLSDEDKRKLGPYHHWNSLQKDEQTKIREEITKEEYTSQSALEVFAWRKLTDVEQNTLLEKPVLYQDNNQTLLKNTLKDAEAESALKAVARMDVEIQRAIKFLQISTDLRLLQKRADTDSKPKVEEKPKLKRKPSIDQSFGQRVICRFDPDGFFYPGIVKKNEDGRTIVRFNIGIEQEAIGHILLPTNGAIAQPNLFVNDYVFARQMNGNEEFWAPGIVMVLPSSGARPPPLYMVQIYTPSPHRVHVHRRDILKISLGLFQRTLLYLQSLNQTPQPFADDQNELQPMSSLKDTIRKELEPLTTKIEHFHKSHSKRYNQLKTALEDQMDVIKHLQERTPKTNFKFESTQTAEISVKPRLDSPKPMSHRPDSPKPIPSPKPSIIADLPQDFIQPNTHVYAVWMDNDRLVYEGTVLEIQSDPNKYRVRRTDLPNTYSIISREDIFLHSELKCLKTWRSKSFALVKKPKDFCHCWQPAVILNDGPDERGIHVRYYDCDDKYLPTDEKVILINEEQFARYATSRIEFENSLKNQVIVGLNEDTKTFMLGTIIDRVQFGHTYVVKWCDGKDSTQEEEHLFGAFTKRIKPEVDCFVLAIDNDECIYKAAKVVTINDDKKTLTVRFLGSTENHREADVPTVTTFVITEAYYNSIIKPLHD